MWSRAEKEKTAIPDSTYEFYELYDTFTLSFRRRDIPTREEAEKLIIQLIRDSLEEEKPKGSVKIEIQTDLRFGTGVFSQVAASYHIGFVHPLSSSDKSLLCEGLQYHKERRDLGMGKYFYTGAIQNAKKYLWSNNGCPSRHKIKLRKKRNWN